MPRGSPPRDRIRVDDSWRQPLDLWNRQRCDWMRLIPREAGDDVHVQKSPVDVVRDSQIKRLR